MSDSPPTPTSNQPHITVGVDGFSLPVEEVLQGRAFITGKSGSGKSNTVAVTAEKLLDAGYPVLIFDIDGEYVSLKESYDLLHVGGDQNSEKIIGPEHADALAEIGIDQRQPILVDLSGFAEHEEDTSDGEVSIDEIVAALAKAFFSRAGYAKRDYGGAPYLLIVEEMHEYLPQQGALSKAGRRLVKVGKRGRKRGLGLVGVSQRPQAVDKNYITQCDWLVWHRLSWDSDTRVAGEILGADYANKIEGLDDGEAFVMTDWMDDIRRIQMQRRQTTDLGNAPGLDGTAPIDLKTTDTSILDELDDAAEAARTKQARIEQLEDRLEEVKADRDDWKERYQEAEYLAEVSAEVQQAQQANATTADPDIETVNLEISDAAFTVPDRLKAEVLEIQQAKSEAESLAEDYREAAIFWWDQWNNASKTLPPEIEQQLEGYSELLTDLSELLATHQSPAIVDQPQHSTATSDASSPTESAETATPTKDRRPDSKPTDPSELSFAELLNTDTVQEAIDLAAEETRFKREHHTKLLKVLNIADHPLSAGEAAKSFDVSASTIRPVAKNLRDIGLITADSSGRATKYQINRTFIERRVEAAQM